MKSDYSHIFSPLTVKSMTIKNRIVMMPMGTNYGEQNGEMSFLHINYYEERAKGGTGLIIVENASVDSPQGSNGTTQLRIDHDNYLPRLFKFCETIHRYGTKVAIQINHAGASAISSRTNMQPVSASDIPSKAGGEIPRPLEKDEIFQIVKKYGEAAKRAQTAGFDAVEIHAGHSYLISQFLSPITNRRTDEFGGSIENRVRFCRLVIEEVRKQVGEFFPIMLRLSADELMEGGNTLEDTLKYLEYVQDQVDIFDVSCGLNGSIQYQIDANYLKDGWRSYMAKAVRDKFQKPCISMGNMRDPEVVEQVLADGEADLIGMGRGLIADPEWVNKVAEGRDLDPVTKNDTKDMMAKHEVKQLTKTALLEVKDHSFLVKGADGERYELPFDYGFVCLGMRAQGQMYQELLDAFAGEDVEVLNIGDSQRARRIIDGTQEGRNILTILEQKGYLG